MKMMWVNYLNYLNECDCEKDASDKNELPNGKEPDTVSDKDIKKELVDECECDASEANELNNGEEPDTVDKTVDDIADELVKESFNRKINTPLKRKLLETISRKISNKEISNDEGFKIFAKVYKLKEDEIVNLVKNKK